MQAWHAKTNHVDLVASSLNEMFHFLFDTNVQKMLMDLQKMFEGCSSSTITHLSSMLLYRMATSGGDQISDARRADPAFWVSLGEVLGFSLASNA